MELTPVEKFTKYTKINVHGFLDRFVFFIDSKYYTAIYQYLNGNIKEPNAEAFEYLTSLENDCNSILSKIKQFKNQLTRVGDRELLYQIEEARIKLKTVRNLAFFLRTNVGGDSGVITTYTLGKNENLQDVSDNVLNDEDFLNDWVQIALKNRINEVSYNTEGGLVVNLLANKNLIQGSVQAVLGSQIGSEVLGRDIQRKIQFLNDDIKILENKGTFLQSVDICLNLQHGDLPQNPRLGITPDSVVGESANTLNFPIVLRELSSVFTQDDTISKFKVLNLEKKEDYLLVNIEVTAITGEAQTFTLSLQ